VIALQADFALPPYGRSYISRSFFHSQPPLGCTGSYRALLTGTIRRARSRPRSHGPARRAPSEQERATQIERQVVEHGGIGAGGERARDSQAAFEDPPRKLGTKLTQPPMRQLGLFGLVH
jgi:hypothetical protein